MGTAAAAAADTEQGAATSAEEVAPLVGDSDGGAGSSSTSVAGGLAAFRFARKLKVKAEGEAELIDAVVQKSTLVGNTVEYLIQTRFRFGEHEPQCVLSAFFAAAAAAAAAKKALRTH